MNYQKLKEKLLDNLNTEQLIDLARDINSWDNSLDHLEMFDNNEDFFHDYFSGDVDKAVRAVCFGTYNYMHEYVKFNGYGNLDSYSDLDYHALINENRHDIIERAVELTEGDNFIPYSIYDYIKECEEEEEEEGEE